MESHAMNDISGADEPVHTLQIQGTGFFSKGECTACDFTGKGHPDDIRRLWDRDHPAGGATVHTLPEREPLPAPSTDPIVRKLENRIIVLLCSKVDFDRDEALLVAAGVAQARALVIGESDGQAARYLATMLGRIAHLTRRQREKLRHPSRDRLAQQEILEDS